MKELNTVIKAWQQGDFKPVYWIEGEEDYYIDLLTTYGEKNILTEEEASFNLSIYYGRDTDFGTIYNACRKFPMFGNRQVVIVKEAQMLKEIDKMDAYFSAPLPSTILIISYKGKMDKRLKIYKSLTAKTEFIHFAKIKDEKLPEWIKTTVETKGFRISNNGITMMAEQIGNDLSRLSNEIDKLAINLEGKNSITEEDIEKYIGLSKDFNAFELCSAIYRRDREKIQRILNYFEANPKDNAIQKILPALYYSMNNQYIVAKDNHKDDASIKSVVGYNPNAIADAKMALKNYTPDDIERMILLLHHYNLKSVGINSGNESDASLLKEMIAKMMVID